MEIALSKIEGDFEVKKEQGRVYVFCPENYDYDEAVDSTAARIRYRRYLPGYDLRRAGL